MIPTSMAVFIGLERVARTSTDGREAHIGIGDRLTGVIYNGERPGSDKDLWRIVKPHVRAVESSDAVLIIDDSVEEKPYSEERELITWHHGHNLGRTVKGVNLLSGLHYRQACRSR